jgi:hypothetical protein
MQLRTRLLNCECIRAEVPQIVEWLRERNVHDLSVMYGVGCNVDAGHRWELFTIQTEGLLAFISDAEARGIVTLGQSDVFLFDSEAVIPTGEHTFSVREDMTAVSFRLCHESDIHVESNDPAFIELVLRHWRENGWAGYSSEDGRKWLNFDW